MIIYMMLPEDYVKNNDKFAIDRNLPYIERDDIIIIHDVGASRTFDGV